MISDTRLFAKFIWSFLLGCDYLSRSLFTAKRMPFESHIVFFFHLTMFLLLSYLQVFIAQEQRCLKRLWISDRPCWIISFMSEMKRRHIYIKLVESTRSEDFSGSKIISISFLYATMPVWLLFFALGISSDKEAFDVIDMQDCDASVINTISATIKESDELCEGFHKSDKARQYVDELVKS